MSEKIKILLVDDIPEAREGIKKLLAFESDFEVVGTASNGREGVQQAKDLRPDIIIMDINMPDMDGLEAANIITKAVPTTGIIMVSVQDDADYMRRAMLSGARNFLNKPVDMDELYSTIRSVYQQYEVIRESIGKGAMVYPDADALAKKSTRGSHPGHVIIVYSPQGGTGKTTVATNLASGLMRESGETLLIDADPQFGDVSFFLNLQTPTTLVDLVDEVNDMDMELFNSIVMTHDSGLKVIVGAPRPELGDKILANPSSVATIIDLVRKHYNFVVVDTATIFNEVSLALFDIATKIVLVVAPTLTSVKNTRLVLDLFDQLEYPSEKAVLVLNKAPEARNRKKHATLTNERIATYLKREIVGEIPMVDEGIILSAINRGLPVIASERDETKSPTKEMLAFSRNLHHQLMGDEDIIEEDEHEEHKSRFGKLFG